MEPLPVNTVINTQHTGFLSNDLPIDNPDVSVKKSVEYIRREFVNQKFTEMQLQGNHFLHCAFNGCTFEKSVFRNTKFDHCEFNGSHFQEPLFVRTDFNDTKFIDCNIESGSFEEAQLSHVAFKRVSLYKTHFFQAKADNLNFEDCDLHHTALFGLEHSCLMHKVSKRPLQTDQPLVPVLVSTQERSVSVPMLVKTLSDVANVVPIRLWMDADESVRPQLDREVTTILNYLNSAPLLNGKVIAQELLHRIRLFPEQYPHSMSVLNKARNLAPWMHAVVLPGGEDIPPALYGQAEHPETKLREGYHRSLLELALIEQCKQKGIPLMGVCRGFQMISVYSGAQLHQHLGGKQSGVREMPSITKQPHKGMLSPLLSPLVTALYHHQGVPVESDLDGLEPLIVRSISDTESKTSWDVIMAVEQKHGSPLQAFQFHPEFHTLEHSSSPFESNSSSNTEQLKRLEQDFPVLTPEELAKSPSLKYMTTNNQELIGQIGALAGVYKTKKQLLSEVRQDPSNHSIFR